MFRAMGRVGPVHWMVYDASMVVFACALASVVIMDDASITTGRVGAAGTAIAAALLGGNVFGLYERRALLSRIGLVLALGATTVVVLLALNLYINLVLYKKISRWILVYCGAGFFFLGACPRFLAYYAVRLYRTRILAIADAGAAREIARSLKMEEECYDFVGYCGTRSDPSDPAAGGLADVPSVCRERRVDHIVVTRSYVDNPAALEMCFEAAQLGCEVQDESSFHEEFLEKVQIDLADKGAFFNARIGGSGRLSMYVKRTADVVIAFLGMLVGAPLFAVIWLLLRVFTKDSALFAQERCGQFGKPFTMYKFRTMRADAEPDGARWTETDDPRITRLGRVLRKSRLDEIPQFWNILRGDMSFVGPRPERPELVDMIERHVPYFSFRHWARPGMTGLAQIRFRYGAGVEDAREKLRYDLYYIKNWSFFLDATIILRTLSMLAKGAR